MPARSVALLLVVAALAGGCAGDDAEGAGTPSPSTTGSVASVEEDAPVLPVTVTGADDVEVTVTDVSRIIPATGDLAEVVFALGLGDRVVATDLSATFPPEAADLPDIGYQRTLVAETVLSFEPTVVLATTLAGPPGAIDGIREVGVPLVVVERATDLAAPAAKVRAVAAALGVPGRGEVLARQIEADIAATQQEMAGVAASSRPRVAFLYLRGEAVQQLAGEGSGVDALFAAAGAVDVGTELGVDEFQPLTDEALVEAAPEILVVTTTGLESVGGVDGLVALPAIAATPAGRSRRVLAFEDQLLLGLGPRTPEILRALAIDLHADPPTGGNP